MIDVSNLFQCLTLACECRSCIVKESPRNKVVGEILRTRKGQLLSGMLNVFFSSNTLAIYPPSS